MGCFYVSRNKVVFCIYKHVPEDEQPYKAVAVRSNGFYPYYSDGRYDSEGLSDNTLERQVQPDEWGRFHEMGCSHHLCVCGPGAVEGI
jgi:hypothetical protein